MNSENKFGNMLLITSHSKMSSSIDNSTQRRSLTQLNCKKAIEFVCTPNDVSGSKEQNKHPKFQIVIKIQIL